MSYHWVYTIGSKACFWSSAALVHVWPQPPCNVQEAWNTGWVIAGGLGVAALFSIYRRLHAWHSFYSR